MPHVTVHLLPTLLPASLASTPEGPEQFKQASAVVIDILRASTTIIHALAAGATQIVPTESVDQVHMLQKTIPATNLLTGGERHGVRIEGFDLDNSPFSYHESVVRGRTILFTTTNGTRALAAAREAGRIFIGAFVNRAALVEALRRANQDVHLVCAGTDGLVTAEDCLFAGVVANDLIADGRFQLASDASTLMAHHLGLALGRSHGDIRSALETSRGGHNLLHLGFAQDVERCATENLFACVPEWDDATGTIRLPPGSAAGQEQFQI